MKTFNLHISSRLILIAGLILPSAFATAQYTVTDLHIPDEDKTYAAGASGRVK